MKLSAILAPLIAAKVPHDIIMQTVQAWEAEQSDALEKRREADRIRQDRKRQAEKSRDITLRHSDTPLVRDRVAPVDVKQITIDTPNEEKEDTGAAKPLSDVAQFKAELAPILDKDRIEALCAVRRKKKATFSAHAGKLLVGKLNRCPDVAVAADAMILGNWTSVEPEWLQGRQKSAAQSQAPPHETAHARHQRECREAIQQELNGNRGHDEFTSGPAFDLEKRDYRAH